MPEIALLPTAFDAMRQAVVLLEAGRVVRLNKAAEVMFSTNQNAIGRRLIEVVRDHRLEALAQTDRRLELEFGTRAILAQGVHDGLLLEDITQSREQDREQRNVLAMLAHEFRTPVAAIKGLLEALREDLPDATRTRFLELGLNETERLVRLVEDLTIGFRAQTERTFVFTEVLARAQKLLENELRERRVQIVGHGFEKLVRCDPDKLLQVCLNLLENAMRYGLNPGEITFKLELESLWLRTEIQSQGPALPDNAKPFEARWRGPNSQGSGMGLYIVSSIVHGWGGQVWYRHTNGINAFGFTVPTTASTAPTAQGEPHA